MAIMFKIQLSPLLVETIKIYKGDYFTCAVKDFWGYESVASLQNLI